MRPALAQMDNLTGFSELEPQSRSNRGGTGYSPWCSPFSSACSSGPSKSYSPDSACSWAQSHASSATRRDRLAMLLARPREGRALVILEPLVFSVPASFGHAQPIF